MVNLVESKSKPKSKRIFYFDLLRSLAIFFVIVIHAFTITKYLVYGNMYHTLDWFICDFLGSCCRMGVLLFLMLAGALSLGRDWDIKSFLGKRIPRIVMPFLFWGFVLSAIVALFVWFYPGSTELLNKWALSQIKPLSTIGLRSYLTFLVSYYMGEAYTSHPYWFFWMILGTYLIMPIKHSELSELEYFLFFWLITCLFDFTIGIPFPIKLTYFVSPIGLVVLGYYLRYTDRKILNNPYFDLLLMIGAFICELLISYCLSTPDSIYAFDRYSLFNSIAAIGLFLFLKNIGKFNIHINFFENPDGIFRRFVFGVAKNSYGMYLMHYVVLAAINIFFSIIFPDSTFIIRVTVFIVLTYVLSWGIIEILSRIPYLEKYVGSK